MRKLRTSVIRQIILRGTIIGILIVPFVGQAEDILNYSPGSEDERAILEVFTNKIIPGAKDLELFLSAFTDDASMGTRSFGIVNGKKSMREKFSTIWPSLKSIRMKNIKINVKGQQAKVKAIETWTTEGRTTKYTGYWTLQRTPSGWFVTKKRIR